uniref:Ribosomal protein S2 n=1 Tax=Dictyopteris divaricata TaxID=156996 RepID=A0A4Y5T7Q3_9PHAE|nr:ribosomal protein S2 [Dictyopteris divaricata]QDB64113.1 ribosomal protein S2 [Dictyopteris divaricata]
MKSRVGIKYNNILPFFVKNQGYLGPNMVSVDKSLYPLLMGKREGSVYFNLNINIVGIKNSLQVLEDIVVSGGKIFFVGGAITSIPVLLSLTLAQPEDLNIKISPWNFSKISNTKDLDLLILHEVENKSILESQSKTTPFIGVYCSTVKGVTYPINLNFENIMLSNWYLYSIVCSCRRGLYRRNKKINEI